MLAALVHCAPLLVAHASGSTNSWRLLLESAISVGDVATLRSAAELGVATSPPSSSLSCWGNTMGNTAEAGRTGHQRGKDAREGGAK